MSHNYKYAYKRMINEEVKHVREDITAAPPVDATPTGAMGSTGYMNDLKNDPKTAVYNTPTKGTVIPILKRGLVGKCACKKKKCTCAKDAQKQIMDSLKEKYNVHILMEDDDILNVVITDKDHIAETIDQLSTKLSELFEMEVRRVKDNYVVYINENQRITLNFKRGEDKNSAIVETKLYENNKVKMHYDIKMKANMPTAKLVKFIKEKLFTKSSQKNSII